MQGTVTLQLREVVVFGFGLAIGMATVVAIVVSTNSHGSYLQCKRKKRNRKREEQDDAISLSKPDDLSWTSDNTRKDSINFYDSIGRLRPEARMAIRLRKNSLIEPSSETKSNDGEEDQTNSLNSRNSLTNQKRIQSLTQIYEKVINEHAIERDSVTVQVPATSANMGPGFDCLGMALNIWSEVTIERSDKFEITYEGEGENDIPLDKSNLIATGLRAAFSSVGKPVPDLRIHVVSRIPFARGLGSSSAAIVGGLIGGLVISGHRLPCWGSEELLQLASTIEGHPDNVAPALYGGCQLGIFNGERWQSERVQLPPGIQVILFVPTFSGETHSARNLLEDTISRKDAAFSIGRVAWLINALTTGNLDNLAIGCQDSMHQPQRGEAIYTYLDSVVKAAIEAGADAAYLSGAGPSVAAITSGASGDIFTQRALERVDKEVATAMLEAARKSGVNGKVLITEPSATGAFVLKASPQFSEQCIKFQGDT